MGLSGRLSGGPMNQENAVQICVLPEKTLLSTHSDLLQHCIEGGHEANCLSGLDRAFQGCVEESVPSLVIIEYDRVQMNSVIRGSSDNREA